ncbi:carbohydrate ABC transporter membrane protein 1 (CUT1 family) [Nocardioides albertanoniae]|uniref:Carbohydrate ABC transporter membrane protein 1 (CUT1 family) n=2 Tax=Nocardioides albertanoniae TaxID=1175486 RepID=A0A543A6S2_9ACTN|nr:carbohydrate ABC transporter membrane protein 1 (CUT1 family) [Nocardioides albertanoniae]
MLGAVASGRPHRTTPPPSAPPRTTSPRSTPWRQRAEIAFFVTPALALMALFIAWPVLSAVRFSVYDWNGLGPLDDFVGFANYADVLKDDVFTDAVIHNLVIVVGSIIVQLPLGVALALLLNRRMAGQGLLRTLIFVPYVLAEVIAGVIWFQLLQPDYGLIDAIMGGIGLTPPDEGWLGTPEVTLWVVLAVLTWKYLGLAVLLFLAGLQSVPEELYEAAQLDGASWFQTQWRVSIPLLGPTIRTWCFLSMIGSIQCFDMIWVLTGGGPADATTTMATYLVDEGTNRHNYGIAGAASVVLFAIAFVMALAYQLVVLRRDTKEEA